MATSKKENPMPATKRAKKSEKRVEYVPESYEFNPLAKESKKISFEPLKIKLDNPLTLDDAHAVLKKFRFQIPLLVILVALLSSFLTFAITKNFEQKVVDQTSFLAKISGGVALSEPELKDVVAQLKTSVYWAGALDGAKYTINASTPGQIYIRYLPDGNGVNDTSPKYRVIATYIEKDAYTSTLAAGNEVDGVSFTTPEGTVVHYNKSIATNVYTAFQGKNYQIEVFDPSPKIALEIATTAKRIKLIQ